MQTITIEQIEKAINVWREREAGPDDATLCAPARALADAYGTMIYHRRNTIERAEFTPEQDSAFARVFGLQSA
jgi:hypothetical protein